MFHVTWLGMITHEVIVWLLLPHVPACDHWVHDDWPMGATVGQSRCCRWQKLNYIAPWGSDVWVFLGTPNYSTKKITIHQVYTCIHILVGKTYGPSMPNSSDLTGSNTRVILFFVSPKASIQKNRVKQKTCSPKICNHQIRHQLPQKKSKKSTKNI